MKPVIYVVPDRCKGCRLCVAVCQAGVLECSAETNRLGIVVPFVKDAAQCMNCGMCEMICPEFAIWVKVEKNVTSDA